MFYNFKNIILKVYNILYTLNPKLIEILIKIKLENVHS